MADDPAAKQSPASSSQAAKDNDPVLNELKAKLRKLNEKEKELTQQDDGSVLKDTVEGRAQNAEGQQAASVEVEDAIRHQGPPLDTESFFQKKQSVIREDPHVFLEDQKITNLVMNQIKELITINNNLSRQFTDLEARYQRLEKDFENLKSKVGKYDDRMLNIDTRLEKFLGLYEIVTNQFNPFVEQDQKHLVSGKSFDEMASQGKAEAMGAEPDPGLHEIPAPKKVSAAPRVKPDAPPQQKDQDDFYEKLIDTISDHIQDSLHKFEDKIQKGIAKSVDDSVRERLHATLEHLDKALEEEMTHMIHRQTADIKKDQEAIKDILKDIDKLLPEKKPDHLQRMQDLNRSISDIEGEIEQIKSAEESDAHYVSVREQVLNKEADADKHFTFSDGLKLKTLSDLLNYLRDVDVSLFNVHVGEDKNDFADWVHHVFGWDKLADVMRRSHTPQEMIHAIDDFVNHYEDVSKSFKKPKS